MSEKKVTSASTSCCLLLTTPEEVLWKLAENEYFPQLRNIFKSKEPEGVDKESFLQVVATILGSQETINESLILDLFNNINRQDERTSCITWNDFLDFNLKALQPKGENPWQLGNITYEQPKEFNRDSIVKIVLLETSLYFSYAILTKHGRISLVDAEFRHLTSYQAIMSREDQFRSAQEARKRYRWLTDAIFMPDVNMFVVVNSARSMTIYDASGLKHVALWHISGFPTIIQAVAYTGTPESTKAPQTRAMIDRKSLILGMDNGEIARMTFLKPKDDLLMKKHQDKMSLYYFVELNELKDYVQYKVLGKFHSNSPVVSIQLLEDRKTLVTCSREERKSLMVVNIEDAHVSHCISTKMGINCFATSFWKKILITGSDTGVIQVWSLHKRLSNVKQREKSKIQQYSKSMRIIRVEKTGIVDIVVFETLGIFICCSRHAELKFYDLKEYTHLQNVKLDFECFDILKIRTPEWGTKCIFPGPKRMGMTQTWERNCFLVTCCNAYAKIELFYMDGLERHLHGEFLPPQPLQNSVLIPQDWEYSTETTKLRIAKDPEEFLNKHSNAANDDFESWLKDLLNFGGKSKEKSEIHSKIALLEERKAKMKWAVEHCAPFLALDLYHVEEVELQPGLPTVENKRTKSIVEKTRKLLDNAVAHSVAFSDISSSQTSKTSPKNSQTLNYSGRLSCMSSNSSILEFE